MIHLDTNVMVALPALARQNHPLAERIRKGEPVATSAIAWFELSCGPMSEPDIDLVRVVLRGEILALDESIAERAASLFNAVGRKRALRTDCLVAASALHAGAELATFNAVDFRAFAPMGLRLTEL